MMNRRVNRSLWRQSSDSFDTDMNEFWLGRLSDMIVRRIPKTRSMGRFRTRISVQKFDYSSTAGILVDHTSSTTMNASTTQWSSCQTIQEPEYERFLDSDSPFSAKRNDSNSRSDQSSFRHFSLGRLSLLILILATLADQAIVQIYHRSSSASSTSSPRFSLGSAAISTVTEKLSPILPFAGGMDIRRDDYWSTGSWLESVRSITTNVQDAYQRKQHPTESSSKPIKQPHKKKPRGAMTLSVSNPFVSVDSIAELTLGDVGDLFRWASGQTNYRPNARVTKMISAMESATQTSFGSKYSYGSPEDSLKFVAAMRIFAEWRIVRQVPDGYKGFAVGMSLGHKDVVQNLVKMEEAIHQWLGDHPDSETPPTLRELLVWEIETGVNPRSSLPRLKEKSAGIGLLWVRRQLAYQTKIFDNVVHSARFPSMKDAVSDAYKAVYDRYHGWAVQKIFNYSFQAAPDATEILRHMNPHKLREVMANPPVAGESSTESSNESRNPIQAFFHHIGEEWDKLRGAKPSLTALDVSNDDYITKAMVQDAHIQIAAYLQAAQPVLENLASLFEELNMDDPSRV